MRHPCRLIAAAIVAAAFAFPPAGGAAAGPRAMFTRERAASGGDAWRNVVALHTIGTLTQGAAANPFHELIDHHSGWSRQVTRVGSLVDVSGFDGVAWDFEGGPVSEQTLPGLAADNVTQAYIARDGWWNPADPAAMSMLPDGGVRVVPRGGSVVDVWFDPATGLIARLVLHTDTGLETEVLDDYRAAGDVTVAFRNDTRGPTGAETVVQVRSVEPLAQVAAGAFARPQPRSDGALAGPVPAVVLFRLSDHPGAIVVDVHAGASAVPVIFDSGGANFFVPGGAQRLGLRGAGGLSIAGVGNGSASASIAALPSLALGGAVLRDQHAILAPLPYAFQHASHDVDIYGLVGAEFLGAFRTSFDFVGRTARFAPFGAPAVPARGATVLPVLSDGQHAYVRAAIDGVSGVFLLDTGDSGEITVFRRFADAHGLFRGAGLPYLAVGGVGGHLSFSRYRAESFTLGGATLHAPPVIVSDAAAGSFASRSVAGNIGLPVISRYDITFDLRAQTVTLAPNALFNAPFAVDRSGFSLNQPDPETFAVLSVVPGSPAAQAGLRPGATIVSVNGTPVGAGRLGLDDVEPYVTGTRAYTLTVRDGGGMRTVTIAPRDILPPAR